MFNETFCSVFTKENLDNIPDKGQSPCQPMPRIHVTLNGVIKCVKRLNPKKASGPDKMPILALQETINETAPVLQSIFQQSLDQSEIPSDWKKANIVPIFKKGDRTKPSNYRPVSLTAVVSKMLEHIVVAQIIDYLDHHNILHENQHGFRSHRSCESQLLLTTDDITKSINQSLQVDMGILDFAKAFDKSRIGGFLGKWHTTGFRVLHSIGKQTSYTAENSRSSSTVKHLNQRRLLLESPRGQCWVQRCS